MDCSRRKGNIQGEENGIIEKELRTTCLESSSSLGVVLGW